MGEKEEGNEDADEDKDGDVEDDNKAIDPKTLRKEAVISTETSDEASRVGITVVIVDNA